MTTHTLVLTPWMSPHRVVPWQESVLDFFQGKVEVLETYDDEVISSPSITIGLPCVVRLLRAVSHHKKGVKFSRINIFTRDGFRCQYCGKQYEMRQLNYDHVTPRHQGGKTVWENIVTSCYPCNTRKDRRTPEQASMKLLKRPYKPKTLPMTAPIFTLRNPPEKWVPYIQSASHVAVAG